MAAQDKIKADHRELLRLASEVHAPLRIASYIKVWQRGCFLTLVCGCDPVIGCVASQLWHPEVLHWTKERLHWQPPASYVVLFLVTASVCEKKQQFHIYVSNVLTVKFILG